MSREERESQSTEPECLRTSGNVSGGWPMSGDIAANPRRISNISGESPMSREERESQLTEPECLRISGNVSGEWPMLGDIAASPAENFQCLQKVADIAGGKHVSADLWRMSGDIWEISGETRDSPERSGNLRGCRSAAPYGKTRRASRTLQEIRFRAIQRRACFVAMKSRHPTQRTRSSVRRCAAAETVIPRPVPIAR